MKNTFLLNCALLSGCAALGQTTTIDWGPAMDCNMQGQGTYRPRIAMNGDGFPVVLWGDMMPNSNYVAVGNGTGFAMPVEVSAPGCEPAVADFMGSSIAAKGNTVWVVMKATPEESKPVYVRRSDDGGLTWGDTMRVDPDDGHLSRFPSIDVADPDAPLVQYMQFNNNFSNARHVVTRLDGSSFSAPVQVSTPFAPGLVCDCCPSQIVADGLRAVALYRNAGPDIRVIYGATSDDAGATFPIGALLDNTAWNLNACPSSGPDGYLVGDSIRYVWMSGANNGTKVYIGSAHADDLALGGQWNVHPDQMSMLQQNFPRIAGSGDTLGVVWQQQMSGQYQILFSWSVTGPAGSSIPDTVNTTLTGTRRTPDIAYADGAFHIVWGESGTEQVQYRKATLSSNVAVQETGVSEVVMIWPDPVVDVLNLSSGRWTSATVYDAQGKWVYRQRITSAVVAVGHLPAGNYLLRLEDGDGHEVTKRFDKQ